MLLLAYQIILAIIGPNQGQLFGVDHLWWIRGIAALLTVLLYFPTRTFASFKYSTNLTWVEYF